MTQDEIIEMAIENTINGLNFNQEGLVRFAHLVAAKEQDRCCAIVFAQCESDNVAQRTVDVIRGKA